MDAAYECDIRFVERVKIFTQEYLKYCKFLADERSTPGVVSKKLYAVLISNSQLLEDFLDFHGAKNNSDWYFFRELSAAVRHLSLACYSQKHILNRLIFYDLVDMENFKREGEATFVFLTNTLKNLAPVIIEEARRLNIPEPVDTVDIAVFPEVVTAEMLPYNIDDENRDQQKQHIVNIASEFIRIAKTLDQFRFYEPYSIEEIRAIVPDKINEVEVRRFEMLVHNLQSSFDTYVIHGGYRFGKRKLKQLRGNFSAVFHLLQVMGRLLHFYERHLYDAGYKNIYKQVQERLAELEELETQLDNGVVTAQRAVNRLWAFIEDEFRISRENAIYSQSIALAGENVLVDVAKIGSVMMYFRTRDLEYGRAVATPQGWRFELFDSAREQELVARLFDSLRKQIRQGYFELPEALPPKGEAPSRPGSCRSAPTWSCCWRPRSSRAPRSPRTRRLRP
ncbi:MAG: DUF3450 family protein, partial [Desulfobacterales bacterium]